MIYSYSKQHGFTLVETLVAITILTISITAPIVLAGEALKNAEYARDQIVAENLAQEAIESVRAIRDGQVLIIARNTNLASPPNLFGIIPIHTSASSADHSQDFTIDPTKPIGVSSDGTQMVWPCGASCGSRPLQTDGILYEYGVGATTPFTRTVHVTNVPLGAGPSDEIKVEVTVTWRTQNLPIRSFTISENLYRWVADGSGT
jgi:prepilin-type N-terminal cleavage/methylation domain-containing protein